MATTLRVLLVEDSDDDAALVLRELRRGGYALEVRRVESREAMSAALDQGAWDVILSDHSMPKFSAPEALRLVHERGIDLPFIVVSGSIGETIVVSLMRAGAHDYVSKDRLSRLVPSIERALREGAARRERRHAEETLRESEERFALAMRGSRDGLWDWNLVTGGYYCSPRFLEMLGYDEHEIEPTSAWVEDRIHADDRAAFQRALAEALEQGAPFDVELRMRTKTGEHRWHCVRGLARRDEAGRPIRMAGSISDLTARKRAEELLQEKLDLIQEQEEAIRALSTPLIEVWEGVLTAPVLGALDAARIADMMESLLATIRRTGCRHVILDLTGVPTMDAATADHVIQLVSAVELLGARGVVVGIQPPVAKALVSVGADLSHVTTLATLRDALVTVMDGSPPADA